MQIRIGQAHHSTPADIPLRPPGQEGQGQADKKKYQGPAFLILLQLGSFFNFIPIGSLALESSSNVHFPMLEESLYRTAPKRTRPYETNRVITLFYTSHLILRIATVDSCGTYS